MANDKTPLDLAIERLEALADKPSAGQDASPDYWELDSSTEKWVVGDYPQTEQLNSNQPSGWGESEGLDADGFLLVPVPEQQLRSTARWTDVLTASLPASWSEGHLFNEKAVAVFKQFDLGAFREYPAIARDGIGKPHTLIRFAKNNRAPRAARDLRQPKP